MDDLEEFEEQEEVTDYEQNEDFYNRHFGGFEEVAHMEEVDRMEDAEELDDSYVHYIEALEQLEEARAAKRTEEAHDSGDRCFEKFEETTEMEEFEETQEPYDRYIGRLLNKTGKLAATEGVQDPYVRPFTPAEDSTKLTIIVGDEEKPNCSARFTVLDALLTDKSDFFRMMCMHKYDWKETRSRIVKLPEVKVRTFRVYMHWVAHGQIDTAYEGMEEKHASAENVVNALTSLTKLWVVADQLQDSKCRNRTMDAMIEILKTGWLFRDVLKVIPPELTTLIWQSVTEGRALRQLALDFYTNRVSGADLKENVASHHPDFLNAVMLQVLDVAVCGEEHEDPTRIKTNCLYHEHDDMDLYSECPEALLETSSYGPSRKRLKRAVS